MLVMMTVLTWDGAVASEVVATPPRCAAEEWDPPVQFGAGPESGAEVVFGDAEGGYGSERFHVKLQPWLHLVTAFVCWALGARTAQVT